MEYELYHYGILGMKWGIRRFQNEDGSLKPAGEKRYATNVAGQKENVRKAKTAAKEAKAEYLKKTHGGLIPNGKAQHQYTKAVNAVGWQKDKRANEKVKEKLNRENGKKSKHRKALEEKYQKQGMNREEAEIAAYKRVRTEKILAAAAGMTVAAAGVYIAKKEYDKRVDKLIPAGTELQRITSRDISNIGVRDGFYFSMNESDNRKYRGLYGKQVMDVKGQAFEAKLTTKQGMRVASEKSAISALQELAKEDPSYTRELAGYLDNMAGRMAGPKANQLMGRGADAARSGKIDKTVYEALNVALTDHSQGATQVHDKFYRKLTAKGYNAIMDVNDRKYSGYNAKSPMIAFNAKNMVDVKSARQLSSDEVARTAGKEMTKLGVRSLAKTTVPAATAYGGAIYGLNKQVRAQQRSKVIASYRKKHPDSKLSDTEILDNYYET